MDRHFDGTRDPVLDHLLKHIRPPLVRAKVTEIDPQRYTATHEVIMLAATFNVNGRSPAAPDLSQWLRMHPEPDIVAVGFQEIVPLSASNVVMGASLEAAAKWDELISMALCGSQAALQYQQVAAKQMVGLYLSVWVREELLPRVRGVQTTCVGTGIMGYLGNKGAVAMRMRVYDTGVSLVNCHLSSGQGEGDSLKRHADYAEILRRGAYPPDGQSTDLEVSLGEGQPDQVQAAMGAEGQWGEERSLVAAEHAFWMGDLNYRLNMPNALARRLIQEDELEALADGDELIQARRAGQAFPGWLEGPLYFPPTYKFRRGTDQYVGMADAPELSATSHLSAESLDSLAGSAASRVSAAGPAASGYSPERAEREKQRTPAWTDRVLWRSQPGLWQRRRSSGHREAPARLLAYDSVGGMTFSDHRAVHALFCIQAREVVRARVNAEVEVARREVDAAEIAAIPRARLEPLFLNFGLVSGDMRREATLINTGQVPARWQWVAPPGMDANDSVPQSPFPMWARVHPEEGMLQPDATQQITVLVTAQQARASAQGQSHEDGRSADGVGKRAQLDATMILQIVGGSDIFCSLTGSAQHHPDLVPHHDCTSTP